MKINKNWINRTQAQHEKAMKEFTFRIFHKMNVKDGYTICPYCKGDKINAR